MEIVKPKTLTERHLNLTQHRAIRFRHVELPALLITEGHYSVRLAESQDEIDAALKLRYEVFNLELNEGLESSYISGRDEDEFDSTCDHLIAIDNNTNSIIGTYRLRTLEMAGIVDKFYCSGEFELASIPIDVLRQSLEIGRACIAAEHRSSRALFLLWKGLIAYSQFKNKRYMFGCCSLTSQNESEGIRAMVAIDAAGMTHEEHWIKPRSSFACRADDTIVCSGDQYQLPKLFKAYLRFGAKVCSPPAIDRQFKTIDFFVMFDLKMINERFRRLFA